MSAKSEGYTLIELSLVLVLIGITLALGLPKFRQALFTDPLKSTARKIIGSVEVLRERTVRQQEDWFLCFDFEKSTFWQERVASAEQKSKRPHIKIAEDVALKDIWGREYGNLSEGVVKVRFNKKGYVNQTIIHLEDRSGRQLSLLFEPFLGEIKLSEGYIEVGG